MTFKDDAMNSCDAETLEKLPKPRDVSTPCMLVSVVIVFHLLNAKAVVVSEVAEVQVSSPGETVHTFLMLVQVPWAPGWSPVLIHAQQILVAQLGHNRDLAKLHHIALFLWQFWNCQAKKGRVGKQHCVCWKSDYKETKVRGGFVCIQKLKRGKQHLADDWGSFFMPQHWNCGYPGLRTGVWPSLWEEDWAVFPCRERHILMSFISHLWDLYVWHYTIVHT